LFITRNERAKNSIFGASVKIPVFKINPAKAELQEQQGNDFCFCRDEFKVTKT